MRGFLMVIVRRFDETAHQIETHSRAIDLKHPEKGARTMTQDQTAEERKSEVEGYILFSVKQDPAQLPGVQIEINPQPLPPGIVVTDPL